MRQANYATIHNYLVTEVRYMDAGEARLNERGN
jgi:hypothetical protein